MIELHIVQESDNHTVQPLSPGIQYLLDKFEDVFAASTGLPPSRQYDHQIPRIPDARPVSTRPYRVAPEQKTKLEKHIQELQEQGVVVHSNSAFSSPVILVRKSDKTQRLVVDY
jgi:hypothetical protein